MEDSKRRLAEKQVHEDAFMAMSKWRKLGTVGIDRILKDMGYAATTMYCFQKKANDFILTIDAYVLLMGQSRRLDTKVEEV